MIGNDFSDYEDSYPRIAPSPIAVLPHNSTLPKSSVPEVSLIFANNNKDEAHTLTTSKTYGPLYSSESTGPSPPKASVPELSIILQNNQKPIGNVALSNNAITKCNINNRKSGHSTLPTRTFSIFKKEFDKKMASNSVKNTNENIDNFSQEFLEMQICENQDFTGTTDSNEIKKTFNSDDIIKEDVDTKTKLNVIDGKTKLSPEILTENSSHCNCSNLENIFKKIVELGETMSKISENVKEIQNDFENFKRVVKIDLPEILTEVISKQLSSTENKVNHLQSEQKDISKLTTDCYEEEIAIESGNAHFRKELCERSPKINVCEEVVNMDVSSDINTLKIVKKTNINGRLFKKSLTQNTLDPLPENSPLIIPCDRSLVMQKLAEKYLPQNYYKNYMLNQDMERDEASASEDFNDKHVNDLSLASYDYMRKYNLISESENSKVKQKCKQNKDFNCGNMLFFKDLEKGPKFM